MRSNIFLRNMRDHGSPKISLYCILLLSRPPFTQARQLACWQPSPISLAFNVLGGLCFPSLPSSLYVQEISDNSVSLGTRHARLWFLSFLIISPSRSFPTLVLDHAIFLAGRIVLRKICGVLTRLITGKNGEKSFLKGGNFVVLMLANSI